MTTLKTLALMALFLSLAVLILAVLGLLERATRPEYDIMIRPKYFTELGR